MAKHRRQSAPSRRIATTTAVAAMAAVAVPSVANATEVRIPNTDISFNVEGLDQIPNIDQVPNIEQFAPSLASNEASSVPAGAELLPEASSSNSVGEQIVEAARSVMGSPYGWGAAGPNAFDCSGLTSWAYAQAGKEIPRTSQAQAAQGTPVAISDLQPGDLVAYYGGASHIGIYTGNGTIIDSLNSNTVVTERPLDYMPIHSAVRF